MEIMQSISGVMNFIQDCWYLIPEPVQHVGTFIVFVFVFFIIAKALGR